MMDSYKNLIVWQKAMDLVIEIYRLTELFPKSEAYGLSSQMRRASVSIPSNIAEGRRRGGPKEYHRFLQIAFGSGAELETQLEIGMRLGITDEKNFKKAGELIDEVMRMLNKILSQVTP